MENKTCLSIQKTDSNAKQREAPLAVNIKKREKLTYEIV